MQLPPTSLAPDPTGTDSPVAVACPACHAALAVAEELIGGPARCPLCASGFLVPTPNQAAGAPKEPSLHRQAEPTAPAAAKPSPTKRVPDDSRRADRAERSVRRARRNIVMLGAGVCILMLIVLILGTKRKK